MFPQTAPRPGAAEGRRDPAARPRETGAGGGRSRGDLRREGRRACARAGSSRNRGLREAHSERRPQAKALRDGDNGDRNVELKESEGTVRQRNEGDEGAESTSGFGSEGENMARGRSGMR